MVDFFEVADTAHSSSLEIENTWIQLASASSSCFMKKFQFGIPIVYFYVLSMPAYAA